MTETRLTDAQLLELKQAAEGTLLDRPVRTFDFQSDSIFGGVAGIEIEPDSFEVGHGLTMTRTFAHVMAPYIMAFKQPQRPSQPHPGPWRAVRGGNGFDITIEVALARDVRPASFNRLNALWWLVALLRLKTGGAPTMPVVSDTAFAEAPTVGDEPTFWPVEMARPQLISSDVRPARISTETLEWVRSVYASGSVLMGVPHFNRALTTADSAIWSHDPGAAIITLWAAIETLIRPGRNKIGDRLSRATAVLLARGGSERVTLQQRLAKLYWERGESAHDSTATDRAVLVETFDVARRCFIACLDNNALPDCEQLLGRWSDEHPQNLRK